jgi:hypothetical protein
MDNAKISVETRDVDADYCVRGVEHFQKEGVHREAAIFKRLARLSRGAAKVQAEAYTAVHSRSCIWADIITTPPRPCTCGALSFQNALDAMLGSDDA